MRIHVGNGMLATFQTNSGRGNIIRLNTGVGMGADNQARITNELRIINRVKKVRGIQA